MLTLTHTLLPAQPLSHVSTSVSQGGGHQRPCPWPTPTSTPVQAVETLLGNPTAWGGQGVRRLARTCTAHTQHATYTRMHKCSPLTCAQCMHCTWHIAHSMASHALHAHAHIGTHSPSQHTHPGAMRPHSTHTLLLHTHPPSCFKCTKKGDYFGL